MKKILLITLLIFVSIFQSIISVSNLKLSKSKNLELEENNKKVDTAKVKKIKL